VETPAPPKQAGAPIESAAAPEQAAQSFQFFCPYCAHVNAVGHEQEGDTISCAGCRNTITVPPPVAEASRTDVKKPTSETVLKFFCSICGQKLSTTLDKAGASTVCPACNSAIRVPDTQPPPPESAESDEAEAASNEGTFKFHCANCNKKFEALRSWAGRPFVCPSCGAEVTVPEPPGT
jgi:DNA-directed RNA polymerase subunit RPC12/RpoP